jgi:hypothetical protein
MLTINQLVERLETLEESEFMDSEPSFFDDDVLAYLIDPENTLKTPSEPFYRSAKGKGA